MYTIGIDFGTLSARAVLVEVSNGRIVSECEFAYPHMLMPERLENTSLPTGWALQDPDDYLAALESVVRAVLTKSGVDPGLVKGIAWDVTASSILPVKKDGTPLSADERFVEHPHAYLKLWKHNSAQVHAERIEAFLNENAPELLSRYGGKVSAQWVLPKVLEILEEAPEIYDAADYFMEVGDWLTLIVTGELCRNTCAAGFKSFWDPDSGYLSPELLAGMDSRLADLVSVKLRGKLLAPWLAAGHLTEKWAGILGLSTDTVVASGIIDAHSGILGSGIVVDGTLLMIMGTSICHILLARDKRFVPGICGYAADSVMPGFFAYEAGQASVGDTFDWYLSQLVPEYISREAIARGISVHELLCEQAARLYPGAGGLLALDWWNGQRTPLVNNNLSGLLLGMTLRTTPAEIYRALIESSAFGSRMVTDTFEQTGMEIRSIVACGGISKKNPLMMQIFADVLGRPVSIAAADQGSALGAAILAAVASGLYGSLQDAVMSITEPPDIVYEPDPEHFAVYSKLYVEYKTIFDYFGRGGNDVMKKLRSIDSR